METVLPRWFAWLQCRPKEASGQSAVPGHRPFTVPQGGYGTVEFKVWSVSEAGACFFLRFALPVDLLLAARLFPIPGKERDFVRCPLRWKPCPLPGSLPCAESLYQKGTARDFPWPRRVFQSGRTVSQIPQKRLVLIGKMRCAEFVFLRLHCLRDHATNGGIIDLISSRIRHRQFPFLTKRKSCGSNFYCRSRFSA